MCSTHSFLGFASDLLLLGDENRVITALSGLQSDSMKPALSALKELLREKFIAACNYSASLERDLSGGLGGFICEADGERGVTWGSNNREVNRQCLNYAAFVECGFSTS